MPPGGPGGPGGPQGRYLPQGGPGMAPGGPQPLGIPTSGMYPDPRTQMSMASLVEADQQQQQRMMVSLYFTTFFSDVCRSLEFCLH